MRRALFVCACLLLTRQGGAVPVDAGVDAEMHIAPSRQLMKICDGYFLVAADELTPHRTFRPRTESYERYVRASNELASRGAEIRDWARQLLVREDYDARAQGAFLLGKLGSRHQLGADTRSVLAELETLVFRPLQEPHAAEAIDAALIAIADIGDENGVRILPFGPDPIAAAQRWLKDHPEPNTHGKN